jgi:formylglycine-generating enzyme required for sulfatase activity
MGARRVEHDVELAGNQVDVYVELGTPAGLLHRIAVEAKDWSKPVGIDVVNGFAFIAGLLRSKGLIDEGIIVSASGFSKQARNAAKEHGIRLLEPADLEAIASSARAVEQTRPSTPIGSPPPMPSVSQARPESPSVADATPTDAPRKPGRTEGMDAGILQVLYDYLQEHPGDPKVNLNDLIGALGAQRADVIPYLLGLQEKGWLDYDLTDRAESGLVWLTQRGTRVARDAKPEPETSDADVQRPEPEVYASYAAGLRRLLKCLGPGHPRCLDALAYQQRLSENIDQSRVYGDTEARRAERSEVIGRLNTLTLSTVGISFNELCEHDLPPLPPPDVPATVLVPAGPFWMGRAFDDPEADESEKPCHKIEYREYQIGRYPVTNAQYACFLAANPQYPVPHVDEERAYPYNWDLRTRMYPEGKADHPVVLVSWDDADAYCRWLSQRTGRRYRLPTEEEWEKAARGSFPDTRHYPWGDEWQSCFCNTEELGRNGTTSVHEFEHCNRSPLGVVDMAGNVWEWTASWYEPYTASSYVSIQYGRFRRVVRGGSWRHSRQEVCVSCRGRYSPDTRRPYVGFRIASD